MRWIAALLLSAACGSKAPRGPLPPLPPAAYAHYLEGKLLEHGESWADAERAFAAATKLAPDQPMIAVALAHAQAKGKRVDAARATLRKAREQWPDHAAVWQASGELLEDAADEGAVAAYERAVELAPDEEKGYLGLARVQEGAEQLATLRTLVQHVPDGIEGYYRLGVALALAKDYPPAIAAMRTVLERDPDHLDARLDLARTLRLAGDMEGAVLQTRSAFDRSGQAMDIAEELFWVLCEADDRVAAIDLLTLLDDERSDADALGTVAKLQRQLGRIEDARALADKIELLDFDAGQVVHAEVALANSEHAEALQRAMTVVAGSPQFVAARRVAGATLLAMHRPAEALEAVAPARVTAPTDLGLALTTAQALADIPARRPEAAAALAPLSDTPAGIYARARLRERLGDLAGAIAIIEPLARTQTDLASIQNYTAYLMTERGERLADAEVYARRAREIAPGDPAILDTWGWLRLAQGHAREAVFALGHAVRIAPLEPELQIHLAAAWAADGGPKTAAELLDRVAANPSLSDAARAKLAAVRARIKRLAGGTMAP